MANTDIITSPGELESSMSIVSLHRQMEGSDKIKEVPKRKVSAGHIILEKLESIKDNPFIKQDTLRRQDSAKAQSDSSNRESEEVITPKVELNPSTREDTEVGSLDNKEEEEEKEEEKNIGTVVSRPVNIRIDEGCEKVR